MTRHTTLDLPIFNRATVGFDRLLHELENMHATSHSAGYPPYNIIRQSDDYHIIEVAVAGFSRDEVTVELGHNRLVIKGEKQQSIGEEGEYLHRGLATRNFERSFTVADYIEVKEATLTDGVLRIELERIVPESMKTRQIEIQ